MTHPLIWYGLIFVLGTMIGSFLNVVIYRTPALLLALPAEEEEEIEIPTRWGARFLFSGAYVMEQLKYDLLYLFGDLWRESWIVLKGLSFPGSHCGHCQQDIAWYDNLPVLSWFILGGKCRHCKQSYSIRYASIEFLTGLLFLAVFAHYGLSAEMGVMLILVSILWAILWIDFDTQFIFNVMTYPSIFLGLLYNGSKGNLHESLLGGVLAWLLFELVMFFSIWVLQKEGMGGGDVKLAVLLGVWLGPPLMLVALFLAFTVGSLAGITLLVFRRQSRPFPFGPFMVLGALASLSFGDGLWSWYINKSFL